MSRSGVDDVQFAVGMGARGAAVGVMVFAIYAIVKRIWDDVAFENKYRYPG